MNSVKNDLIDKYIVLVYEYLHIMNSSEIIQHMETQSRVLEIGLSAISHIYKLAFFLSKNVATAVCHCQKGMYCYLEYIEQMNKSNMLHNLDNVDAVAFIYEKTIMELYGSSSGPISNMLSMSEPHCAQGNDLVRCTKSIEQMVRLTRALLWFDHPHFTHTERLGWIETKLPILSTLFVEYSLDDLLLFVEAVQEKLAPLTKTEYEDCMEALVKYIKRAIKSQQVPNKNTIIDVCLYLHTQYQGKTISAIAEEEGWRRPAEDLVKTLFA